MVILTAFVLTCQMADSRVADEPPLPGTLARIDRPWWPQWGVQAVSNDGNDVRLGYGWDDGGARLSPSYVLPPQHVCEHLPVRPGSDQIVKFGRSDALIGHGGIIYRRAGGWCVLRGLDRVNDPIQDTYFRVPDGWTKVIDGSWSPSTRRLWLRLAEDQGRKAILADHTWAVPMTLDEKAPVEARLVGRQPLGRTLVNESDAPLFLPGVPFSADGSFAIDNSLQGDVLVDLRSGKRVVLPKVAGFGYTKFAFVGGQLYAHGRMEEHNPGWGIARWDGKVWTIVSHKQFGAASLNGRYAVLVDYMSGFSTPRYAYFLWKP